MSKACPTNLKVGDKVKVIGNATAHSIPLGATSVIVRAWNGSSYGVQGPAGATTVVVADLEFNGNFSQESIASDLTELRQKIAVLETKKRYLDETRQTEGTDTEFRVYGTLKLMDREMSTVEKAKAIASLIDG